MIIEFVVGKRAHRPLLDWTQEVVYRSIVVSVGSIPRGQAARRVDVTEEFLIVVIGTTVGAGRTSTANDCWRQEVVRDDRVC